MSFITNALYEKKIRIATASISEIVLYSNLIFLFYIGSLQTHITCDAFINNNNIFQYKNKLLSVFKKFQHFIQCV